MSGDDVSLVKTAVALSGGVDSAVAAARLQEAGRELVGLTAKLLPDDWPEARGCCDEAVAAELCRRLGIDHRIVDLSKEFQAAVIDYFVAGYGAGLTPNPCLPCNRVIKFGALMDAALAMGCEALATGHYARIEPHGGRVGVRRAADEGKDQSYMLIGLSQEQLSRAVLPLGESLKAEVVEEARRRKLPVLHRESQDVCFVGDDYREFVARFLTPEPGPMLDASGREVGTHRGLAYYTVGQRRGLGGGELERLYVIAKDPARNALIVGLREDLRRHEFEVEGVNWVSLEPPRVGDEVPCLVMVRYRGRLVRGVVTVAEDGRCVVRIEEHNQALAPGQGAAFYGRPSRSHDDGWLLGGGFIAAGWG
jgi:tRNA-specific 2-thiouridylase